MKRAWRAVASAALAVGVLVATPGAGAAAAAELRVVTVLPGEAGGETAVVAEVLPAPSAALPADAALVTIGGATVPASTIALLARDAPTALVVDTSAAAAAALPQTLSGAAGYLLRLPPATPVTVTADGGTPRRVTSVPGPPADAIQALTTLRAGGERSTARALELAVAALPSPAGPRGRGLVLLATSGAPPEGEAGADLQDRLEDAGVVLAVVTAPQFARAWAGLADATGGTAAGVRGDAVPDAFDEVARALRGRSVITFAAPAGTASAELRVRSGGDLLSADVSLPGGEQQQAGGGTTGTGARGAQDEPAQAPGDDTRRGVAVAVVALQLAAAAVVLLVRRRRREQSRSEQQDEDVPQGVRLFDVSDPLAPVELDRARGDRGRLAVGTPADRPDQDEVRDQSA